MSTNSSNLGPYAPPFVAEQYTLEESYLLAPFFTNLDQSVYLVLIPAPELVGALLSRTSRAKGDLRTIFLKDYLLPSLNPTRSADDSDDSWKAKRAYAGHFRDFIDFLHLHSFADLFANRKARDFYAKWLAQYGDDSIAQLAGTHLVFAGLSQIAIKHFEDMTLGIAPIEKSTRYVDYTEKLNGQYLYYTDPDLGDYQPKYREAMDFMFDSYKALIPKLTKWLSAEFPSEKAGVIEKKVFDTLRGLLPMSTLSQVAFFLNGQAAEHLINRSVKHPLGEIRWAAKRAQEELSKVIPSFLLRLKEAKAENYQKYLATKHSRVSKHSKRCQAALADTDYSIFQERVELIEYDPNARQKIVTAILYEVPGNQYSWSEIYDEIETWSSRRLDKVLADYFKGRDQRWQKAGSALENSYVRFEILINIGAWRDLHRHRIQTQSRQSFSIHHGYDTPTELRKADLHESYETALDAVSELFLDLETNLPVKKSIHNSSVLRSLLAQYTACLAHRVLFVQYQNLRQALYEIGLRTVKAGHPDYREPEQAKARILAKVYPWLAPYIIADFNEYDFARRGESAKIASKEQRLLNDK